MKIVTRLLLSVFSVLFAIVWTVQAAGVLGALIPSLDNVSTTTKIIIALSIIVSVVGIILVWRGKISLENSKTAKSCKYICNGYFGSLIALVIIYMALVRDIKYVLLAECVITWVIWFVILGCIRKVEGLEDTQTSETGIKKEEENKSV